MSREELAQEWRERLQDFAQAQTSITEWCFYHRIPVHQFHYWKRRLAAQTQPPTDTPAFLPVNVVETVPVPAATTGVTLRLAGVAIELTPGFDPDTLRAVVSALAALPC
jgi:hypothetical protein